MSFYTFPQNNSNGVTIRNTKLSDFVIIEADSAEEANKLAEDIMDFTEGCSCCGLRWNKVTEEDKEDSPKIFGKSVNEYGTRVRYRYKSFCVIYFKNAVMITYGTKQ